MPWPASHGCGSGTSCCSDRPALGKGELQHGSPGTGGWAVALLGVNLSQMPEIGVWSQAPPGGLLPRLRRQDQSCCAAPRVCLGWEKAAQSPCAHRKQDLIFPFCLTSLSEIPLQRLAHNSSKKIIPSAGAGAPSALAVGRLTLCKQSGPGIPWD